MRYFLEAARLGNVSRAADNLCVTQPTVSRQLKELEEELGEKLFERTNYAIRLTPAGELLRERAEDILSMADRTVQDFKSLTEDEVTGEIAIACAESRNVNFLSKCIGILRDDHPKIKYNLYSGDSERALEKLDRIEIDEVEDASLNLKFPPAKRSGDVVFKASGITVGYPGKVVFRNADIEIKRGEKVALIGRNGEGKTTLVRVMVKELFPIEGEAVTGHNVSIGYYAQNQEDILDRQETVFGTLDRIAVGEIRTRLRDILGAFLFKGEDIDKRVSVLSGGERARLGMAKLMLSPYNVLALDEPTNHMDIRSKDILKQALKSFDGTLIVVSHDRDFLDGLVDKLYEFRDGKVTEYLGTVAEFLAKRRLDSLRELERKEVASSVNKPSEPLQPSAGKSEFRKMKAVSKEERKLRNRIDYLEKQISAHEEKMAEIEKILANPGNNDDILDLTRDYLVHKRTMEEQTFEWTNLMEQIENQ